jgi:hypothetical protein
VVLGQPLNPRGGDSALAEAASTLLVAALFQLSTELLGVLDETMQPTKVSLWIRPSSRSLDPRRGKPAPDAPVAGRAGVLPRPANTPTSAPADIDDDAQGFGHTNATRGTLTHWVKPSPSRRATGSWSWGRLQRRAWTAEYGSIRTRRRSGAASPKPASGIYIDW